MLMMPSIFGEDLFDRFMEFPFERDFFGGRSPLYGKREKNLMKTDIQETDDAYALAVDLPGFKKEDISIKLENGYLTIGAEKSLNKDEEKKDDGYIRRERCYGSCSRSFYVGEALTSEDIKAKLEDGILQLTVPKKAPALPASGSIMIE